MQQTDPQTGAVTTIPCLKLNHENSTTPDTMVFCDARFTIINHKLHFQPFDKAEDLPTLANKLLRYVHIESASTPHSLTSIVLGQLQRLASVSDNPEKFTRAAAHLILQLLGRGHKQFQISKITHKFQLPQLPYITWNTEQMPWTFEHIVKGATIIHKHPDISDEHIAGVRTEHTEHLLDSILSANPLTALHNYLHPNTEPPPHIQIHQIPKRKHRQKHKPSKRHRTGE